MFKIADKWTCRGKQVWHRMICWVLTQHLSCVYKAANSGLKPIVDIFLSCVYKAANSGLKTHSRYFSVSKTLASWAYKIYVSIKNYIM